MSNTMSVQYQRGRPQMRTLLLAGIICGGAFVYGKAMHPFQSQMKKEKFTKSNVSTYDTNKCHLQMIKYNLIQNGCYVHRTEEIFILNSLMKALSGHPNSNKNLGILIYGASGIGKTFTIQRILCHLAGITLDHSSAAKGTANQTSFQDVYLCHPTDNDYNNNMQLLKQNFENKNNFFALYPTRIISINILVNSWIGSETIEEIKRKWEKACKYNGESKVIVHCNIRGVDIHSYEKEKWNETKNRFVTIVKYLQYLAQTKLPDQEKTKIILLLDVDHSHIFGVKHS